MKNFLIKADRAILVIVSAGVRWWVAKKEYKQHKIDLQIKLEWFMLGFLAVWGTALPGVLYPIEGEILITWLHVLLFSLLLVMGYFSVQTTIHQIKPVYNRIFALRKNPEYSKMHGEVIEELFVKVRRARMAYVALLGGLTLLVCGGLWALDPDIASHFIIGYLLISNFFFIVRQYNVYVNDFDEPTKKKKASEAITELLLGLWGELVGGFAPQPAFGT